MTSFDFQHAYVSIGLDGINWEKPIMEDLNFGKPTIVSDLVLGKLEEAGGGPSFVSKERGRLVWNWIVQ